MQDQILKALEASRADFTDIRVEREWRTQVTYRGKELENLEASSELGGIVRCLVDGGWGIAVFNDLDGLQERVADAERIAKIVSGEIAERAELALGDRPEQVYGLLSTPAIAIDAVSVVG